VIFLVRGNRLAGGFRSGGFSMTNVRRQSRQKWISRNIDSMLFVVFCPLQPGQVSGVAQGWSVTNDSGAPGRDRFFPLRFLDNERAVAVAADMNLS
jgi:hypothetical protein